MDALSLQIDMRKYHQQADGIPEHINMLEDAQCTSLRIDKTNPITDTSVLNSATAAMLSLQQFSCTTEEWEDVPPVDKHCHKWKTMYKTVQGRERVRAKSGGGKNSFGGVNADGANTTAADTDSLPTDDAGAEPFTVDKLEACFDNLANTAKAERTTLNKLVIIIAVLTATNSKLVAAEKKWGGENTTLQHEINALRKRGGDSRLTSSKKKGRRPCKHCGGNGHVDADCLELPQNAMKREKVWKIKL